MKNLLIIGLCLSLIGCAHGSIDVVKPYIDPQYGMTKLQMIELLGKPEKIEIYKKSDQSRVEFYFYARYYPSSSQVSVPVCLINGKVAGWGRAFYEDHVSDDDVRIR